MQTRIDQRMREYTDLATRGEVDRTREKRSRPRGKPQAKQKYGGTG